MRKRAVVVVTMVVLGGCATTPPAADASAGRDVAAVDGLPDDRPPLPGVSCVTRQSVPRDGGFCSQTLVSEPNVGFWLTLANLESHNESALRTDSLGIHLYFGASAVSQGPMFIATDDTYTLFRRPQVPGIDTDGMDNGTGRRMGARLDFTMNARRGDVSAGCTLPGVEITCSGSTWLRQ